MADGQERPLGLKAEISVTEDNLERLRKIESIDLRSPARSAVETGEIPADKEEAAQLELKRFFALPVLLPDHDAYSLGPSRALDSLWHNFILDTPRYVRFSEEVFGGYLHHRPAPDSSDDYRAGPLAWALPSTHGRGLVAEFFNDVDLDFWPEDASMSIICYIH